MRFRSADVLDERAVGRRVTVRHRALDGTAADVVGELIAGDAARVVIRTRAGDDVEIERERIIAARVVRGATPNPDDGGARRV